MKDVIVPRCKEAGVFHALLRVSHAFHTPHMDPIMEPLLRALSDLKASIYITFFFALLSLTPIEKPSIPIYSSVTGNHFEDSFDGNYWWSNVRMPVQFLPAVQVILPIFSFFIVF